MISRKNILTIEFDYILFSNNRSSATTPELADSKLAEKSSVCKAFTGTRGECTARLLLKVSLNRHKS